MFRSFQIIIREFRLSLLNLLRIHDLVRFCKQGVVAAYHQHNMICCHNTLFKKNKLNHEYVITLARNDETS